MTLEEMLRGSPLNQQRMADDNAMNLAGMLARGGAGTVRQEPNMVERGLSNVKRSFYGDKNLYGNDPINPSVLDSQYVSPEMAEGAVLDVVGGPMATAWHGSPHKFTKFDMSKIGTGEGAQARGHGLYAAENPAVATGYKERLSDLPNMIHYDGTPLINLPAGEKEALNQLERAMPFFKGPKVGGGELGFSDSVEFVRNKMKDNPAGMQFLDNVDESKIAWGNGYLYKLDIPDDQIAKMLDWDKPLSEQGQHIQDLFPEMVAEETAYKAKYPSGGFGEVQGGGIYGTLSRKLNTGLSGEGAPKASEYLKSKGIPGIKYADQGSRGKYHVQLKYKGEPYGEPVELSAKNQVQEFVKEYEAKGFGTEVVDQGTSNFVLFSDEIAKILERNDQLIGDLAEELLGK